MISDIQSSPGRNIALQDFFKQGVQGLIGVGDEQSALPRAVVVQHMHDLHCCVCLASAGGAHHHCQAGLHPRLDGLDLQRTPTLSWRYLEHSHSAFKLQRAPIPQLVFLDNSILCAATGRCQGRLARGPS